MTSSPEYYDGHVVIKFKCLKTTSRIVLHMNEIQIDESSIELRREDDIVISTNFNWNYVVTTQFLIIQFNESVMRENINYSISIRFKGFLKNDNVGLYKSFYLDDNGQKR